MRQPIGTLMKLLLAAMFMAVVSLSGYAQEVDHSAHEHQAADDAVAAPADPALPTLDVYVHDIDIPNVLQQVKIMEFEPASIGRTTKAMVFLPEDYDEASEKRYPVLYLLHGFSQNYTAWAQMGAGVPAEGRDLIIVMPDAGNSWYVNWAESEDGEVNNWEDLIVYDLIPAVDSTFKTVPSREGRAISGLSMGGYGAMVIGMRHPTVFSCIGSQSGTLGYARNARASLESGAAPQRTEPPAPLEADRDAVVPPLVEIPGFTRQHERYPSGVMFATVEDCNQYDPFFLVQQVPLEMMPHVYIDSGLEDSLISEAREMAAIMMQRGVPFTFAQTPGGHRPSYWSREIQPLMAVQYAIMERNVRMWEMRQAQHKAMGHEHDNVRIVEIPSTPTPPEAGIPKQEQ